jgi:hypothetical protein
MGSSSPRSAFDNNLDHEDKVPPKNATILVKDFGKPVTMSAKAYIPASSSIRDGKRLSVDKIFGISDALKDGGVL